MSSTESTEPLWSDSQVLVRSLVSSISGSLSTLGSLGIIYLIVSDWREKISKIRNRILFGLSIFDVVLSVALALATLPVPKGTEYAAWAIGNGGTCSAQGFFVQLGMAAFLYNASLAIYHLLAIHYQKQDKWIKQKIERYLHIVPISFGVITAIAGAALEIYHYTGNVCALGSYPHQCHVQDDVECIKGQNITLYRAIFAMLPVLLAFIIVLFCMGRIVLSVYQQERKLKRYDFGLQASKRLRTSDTSDRFEEDLKVRKISTDGESTRNASHISQTFSSSTASAASISTSAQMKRTKEALTQALLYGGSFFIVIIWVFIAVIIEETNEDGYIPFAVTCLNYFFRPLQGFFNFFIFIRPKYLKKKKMKRSSGSTERRPFRHTTSSTV